MTLDEETFDRGDTHTVQTFTRLKLRSRFPGLVRCLLICTFPEGLTSKTTTPRRRPRTVRTPDRTDLTQDKTSSSPPSSFYGLYIRPVVERLPNYKRFTSRRRLPDTKYCTPINNIQTLCPVSKGRGFIVAPELGPWVLTSVFFSFVLEQPCRSSPEPYL